MYCPRCGQAQLSGDVRFCSRCGLHLAVVKELIASDGVLSTQSPDVPRLQPSPRQTGVRQGAKLMFLSAVLLPVFFALCFFTDGPGPLLVPLTTFLAGLAWMLYFRIFGEDAYQAGPPQGLGSTGGSRALPVSAATSSRSPVDTGETRPPSVTEKTTNFLE